MSESPTLINREPLRPLSLKQAQRCEDACEPVCKCRCGGAKHGAKRGSGAGFFESLSPDDPHHMPSAEVKAGRKAKHNAAKQREHNEKMRRRYEVLSKMGGHYDDR